jgi:hypothetical protein
MRLAMREAVELVVVVELNNNREAVELVVVVEAVHSPETRLAQLVVVAGQRVDLH